MRWTLDTQRTVICIAGLVLLTASLVLASMGHDPGTFLEGIFAAMAGGPVLEGTATRYVEAKRNQRGEDRGDP